MAEASAGHGAILKMGDGASPEVFTQVPLIVSGPSWDGYKQVIIERRHHDSVTPVKKRSYTDYGPITGAFLYDGTNAKHQAILEAARTGAYANFILIYPDAGDTEVHFHACVDMGLSSPPDDFVESPFTLTPDVGPTFV